MANVQIVDRVAGDPNPVLFLANSPVVQKVDKGFQQIAYMDIRLTGTVTHAGYTVPPSKLVEDVENLISQVILSGTGKGSAANIGAIKSVDAAYLYFISTMLEGTSLPRTDADTNNAAYNFESNFRLYFALPPKGRRVANLTAKELFYCHLFDARFVTNLSLQFQFRDQTAMFSGTGANGGTTTLSSVQITVMVRELTGFPSHTAQGKPIIRPFVKESQFLFDVTATALAKQFKDLPVGNLYRRITFKGTVGANNFSDPSDAPFSNTSRTDGPHLTLKENLSFQFMDVIYQQLRAANKTLFGIENMPTGYAVWDPGTGRNTANLQRLDLFADVNFTNANTNEIQATVQEVVR